MADDTSPAGKGMGDLRTSAPLRRARSLGIAVWVIVVASVLGAMLTGPASDRSAGNWLYLAAIAVVTAVIWFTVIRSLSFSEENTPARVALIVGIIGTIALIVWWSFLPLILGAAALVLGIEGRRRGARGAGRLRMAVVATWLSVIPLTIGVITIWAYVGDMID